MSHSPEIKVSEIFYSVQGEGLRTGQATVFVRFFGCNLRCPFCDTEYALAGDGYEELSVDRIVARVIDFDPCEAVCITGGEPFFQPEGLFNLCSVLKEEGYFIQVETNGSLEYPPGIQIDHVTFSPKTCCDVRYFTVAKELKVVVGTPEDFEKYSEMARRYGFRGPKFIQPDSTSKNSLGVCENLVLKNPDWRLSVQVHKFIGAR